MLEEQDNKGVVVTTEPESIVPPRSNQQQIEQVTEEQAELLENTKKNLSLSEKVLVESSREKNRISELKVREMS